MTRHLEGSDESYGVGRSQTELESDRVNERTGNRRDEVELLHVGVWNTQTQRVTLGRSVCSLRQLLLMVATCAHLYAPA